MYIQEMPRDFNHVNALKLKTHGELSTGKKPVQFVTENRNSKKFLNFKKNVHVKRFVSREEKRDALVANNVDSVTTN